MTALSRLILLAGGSGSGKTTLAEGLIARFPDWTLVHVDDYQKRKAEVPTSGGHRNWDHPDAVDFEALLRDVAALRRGEPVTISARLQKDPSMARFTKTIRPGSAVLVEGYLALWHPALRQASDVRVFIQAPAALRHARRRWNKDPRYLAEVLEPMHLAHVEPTKACADLLLDGSLPPDTVLAHASAYLRLTV